MKISYCTKTSTKWEKSGQCANETGGTVTKIKELIETVQFEIIFRLIMKYKNKYHQFNSDPMQCLMKYCDNEARQLIEKINSKSEKVKQMNLENIASKQMME